MAATNPASLLEVSGDLFDGMDVRLVREQTEKARPQFA